MASKTTAEPSRKLPSAHKPVLRWLGSWSPYNNASPTASPASSSCSTPISTRSSTPPSPGLASLNEALHEPLRLPAIPPIARLPRSFYSSHSLRHTPPFLDNLTRSTMPTASISSPNRLDSYLFEPSLPIQTSPQSPTYQRPIMLSDSRSSLDTLRSVSRRDHDRIRQPAHQRSMSTAVSHDVDGPSANKNWWWFNDNNKEDVDTLLDEADRRATIAEEAGGFQKKYRSPKNPVVFCHGLLGFDSVTIGPAIAPLEVTHWRGIKEVLEANGTEVLITRVPATSSPIERAKVLEQRISAVYPGRSVHLIGHSMGGLDCRYLTSRLERKFDVLSITTIATPHRGSAFADYFLATLGTNRMPQLLNLLDLLPNGGGDGQAFESLTLESMRKFNEEVKDVEGVRYFSWGAYYNPGFVDTWKWPHSVVLEKEGPNDGLVSVESSKWGTYLGTLEDVNHLDLVGWINTARYKWAEMLGRDIKFRPATFYLGVADMLAERVEGQPKIDDGKGPSSGEDTNQAGSGAKVQENRQDTRSPTGSTLIKNAKETVTMTTGEDIAKVTGGAGGEESESIQRRR